MLLKRIIPVVMIVAVLVSAIAVVQLYFTDNDVRTAVAQDGEDLQVVEPTPTEDYDGSLSEARGAQDIRPAEGETSPIDEGTEVDVVLVVDQAIDGLTCDRIGFYSTGFELERDSWRKSRGEFREQEKAAYGGYDIDTLEAMTAQHDILAHQVLAKKYFSAGDNYNHDYVRYRAIALGSVHDLTEFLAYASVYVRKEANSLDSAQALNALVGIAALQYKQLTDGLFKKDSAQGVDEQSLDLAIKLTVAQLGNSSTRASLGDVQKNRLMESLVVERILKIEQWVKNHRETNQIHIADEMPNDIKQYRALRDELFKPFLSRGITLGKEDGKNGAVSIDKLAQVYNTFDGKLVEEAKRCGFI